MDGVKCWFSCCKLTRALTELFRRECGIFCFLLSVKRLELTVKIIRTNYLSKRFCSGYSGYLTVCSFFYKYANCCAKIQMVYFQGRLCMYACFLCNFMSTNEVGNQCCRVGRDSSLARNVLEGKGSCYDSVEAVAGS